MAKIDSNLGKKILYSAQSSRLNRCFAPSGTCRESAIRAHSVQNGAVMAILHRDGHVKAPSPKINKDESFSIVWQDIGRNLATTFEGFCSSHDSALFKPIDTQPFDVKNPEQLFLYAYRAVARELHASMEAAIKVQSMYDQRIEAGIDNGNQPEAAGMMAVERMLHAHATYAYKTKLDNALTNGRYESLIHEIICLPNQAPAVAASVFFDLERRPNEEEPPRTALNIFPTSKDETVALFSFTEVDAVAIREYIRDILESDGAYKKYLLSRMLLTHAENFVIAPPIFDSWSDEKRNAILDFFLKTVRFSSSAKSEHLYLF
ncbi:MAG: hypothetical protein WBE76_18085 [Terracidiphilus sp.]